MSEALVAELSKIEIELDRMIERAVVAKDQELDELSVRIAVLIERVVDLHGQLGLPDPDPADGWEDRLMERFIREVCPVVHNGDATD